MADGVQLDEHLETKGKEITMEQYIAKCRAICDWYHFVLAFILNFRSNFIHSLLNWLLCTTSLDSSK